MLNSMHNVACTMHSDYKKECMDSAYVWNYNINTILKHNVIMNDPVVSFFDSGDTVLLKIIEF